MSKPLILISNDDGITSKGIRALVEVAAQHGEVVVVAPNSPQSAKGHALTIEEPLRLYPSTIFHDLGVVAYECSGTPADCVKLAKNVVLKNRTIALCVSGINHGSNASVNVLYSGTLSAAMEASLEGIPAIGFSLLNFDPQANFEGARHYAHQLIEKALRDGLGTRTKLFNVNIPNLPLAELKGTRVCRQAEGHWTEEFQVGQDPAGRPYYWLTGKFICEDRGEDSDVGALDRGYVSIVPLMHDLTKYEAIAELKTGWES